MVQIRPGTRVLIVEDVVLIAEARREQFEDLGAAVRVRYSVAEATTAKARSLLPDFAVLDVNLEDGQIWPVASHLRAHGVPFVFCSASPNDIPAEFSAMPFFPKLAPINDLIAAFDRQLSLAA